MLRKLHWQACGCNTLLFYSPSLPKITSRSWWLASAVGRSSKGLPAVYYYRYMSLYCSFGQSFTAFFYSFIFLLTRASRVGPSTQCPSVCGGDQDWHVPAQCATGHYETLIQDSKITWLPQNPCHCSKQWWCGCLSDELCFWKVRAQVKFVKENGWS